MEDYIREVMQLPPNAVVPGYVTELFPTEVMDFYASSGHSYGELQPPKVPPPSLGEDSDPMLNTEAYEKDPPPSMFETTFTPQGKMENKVAAKNFSLALETQRFNFSSATFGLGLGHFLTNFGISNISDDVTQKSIISPNLAAIYRHTYESETYWPSSIDANASLQGYGAKQFGSEDHPAVINYAGAIGAAFAGTVKTPGKRLALGAELLGNYYAAQGFRGYDWTVGFGLGRGFHIGDDEANFALYIDWSHQAGTVGYRGPNPQRYSLMDTSINWKFKMTFGGKPRSRTVPEDR